MNGKMKKLLLVMTVLLLATVMLSLFAGPANAATNIIGDVDDSGEVNNLDRQVLTRHLAKWDGYETVNNNNADVNRDGKVNSLDRQILARHLAEWDGYETLPYGVPPTTTAPTINPDDQGWTPPVRP